MRVHSLIFPALALILAVLAAGCGPQQSDSRTNATGEKAPRAEILVLAASDLKGAFGEIGERLEKKEGIKAKFSFGSTGQLAQQVEAGAKADVFAAANVKFVDDLRSKDLIISETQQLYAIGRLVVWSRKDAELHPKKLEELVQGGIGRIAIANPDHAPYGKAAKEAMQTVGVWDKISNKMVLGENATQTLQFGQSGNVDAAVLPLSLATGSDGIFELVPESLHQPLRQSIAVLKETSHEKEATAFVDFVTGSDGRAILKTFGFQLP